MRLPHYHVFPLPEGPNRSGGFTRGEPRPGQTDYVKLFFDDPLFHLFWVRRCNPFFSNRQRKSSILSCPKKGSLLKTMVGTPQ